MFMLVDTDNFDGDYPDEKFLSSLSVTMRGQSSWVAAERTTDESKAMVLRIERTARTLADAINEQSGEMSPRYIKVVPVGYKLKPGFEP